MYYMHIFYSAKNSTTEQQIRSVVSTQIPGGVSESTRKNGALQQLGAHDGWKNKDMAVTTVLETPCTMGEVKVLDAKDMQ